MKPLLVQHDILRRHRGKRSRVKRGRDCNNNVQVAVLRPDGSNGLGKRSVRGALVQVFRSKLVRRDAAQIVWNCDGRPGFGMRDDLAGLFLCQVEAEAGIDAKVDSNGRDDFTNAKALYNSSAKPSAHISLRSEADAIMTYTALLLAPSRLARRPLRSSCFGHCAGCRWSLCGCRVGHRQIRRFFRLAVVNLEQSRPP